MSKSKKSDYIEVFGYKIPRWPVCSMGELEALEAYHSTPGATNTGSAIVMIAAAITYRLGEKVTPDDLRKLPVEDPQAISNAVTALSESIDAARKLAEKKNKESAGKNA